MNIAVLNINEAPEFKPDLSLRRALSQVCFSWSQEEINVSGSTVPAPFTGGSGTGLICNVTTADNTTLEKINVTAPGSGYKAGDVLQFATVGTGSSPGDYAAFNYTLVADDFEHPSTWTISIEEVPTGITPVPLSATRIGTALGKPLSDPAYLYDVDEGSTSTFALVTSVTTGGNGLFNLGRTVVNLLSPRHRLTSIMVLKHTCMKCL